jgi:hypothetical protein
MKTVPFNPGWLDAGSLDLMAVYRRPRVHPITKERATDDQGRQLWDYVNLSLKRHNDWTKKGFQYVTLARVADLIAAKCPAAEFLSSYKRSGEPEERTFNIQAYLQHADVADDAEFEGLTALVHQLGSATVEAVRRHSDPGFVLPPTLQNIPPGGPVATDPAPPDVTDEPTKTGKRQKKEPIGA